MMIEEELDSIANGDKRRQRLLQQSLEQLAVNADGPLREMARSVLKDEISLRDASRSDYYGSELGSVFQRFWSDYQEMDDSERQRAVKAGKSYLESLDTK